jgi:hypothetical protein
MAERTATAIDLREVTHEEVAFYRDNGWVKLERLIGPELAGELLRTAQGVMGDEPEAAPDESEELQPKKGIWPKMGGRVQNIEYWQNYHFIARDDRAEPFHSLVFSKEIGRAAQRLMARDVPVRYSTDAVACKMPAGRAGNAPTDYHQDISSLPFDRVGPLTFWFALNDMTPEFGTMRFLSGSHRAGNLGRTRAQGRGTIEYYPELLDEYELSPPLSLQAGDATVHNAQVIHGSPENSTATPRWGYIVAYFPGDALWTGAFHHNFSSLGLEVNKPFEHPSLPVVYP